MNSRFLPFSAELKQVFPTVPEDELQPSLQASIFG